MDLKKYLENLISIYDNDVSCGIEDEEERKKALLLLGEVIILVTKIHLGIQCCSRNDCPANPMIELKRIITHKGSELKKIGIYEEEYEFLKSIVK